MILATAYPTPAKDTCEDTELIVHNNAKGFVLGRAYLHQLPSVNIRDIAIADRVSDDVDVETKLCAKSCGR